MPPLIHITIHNTKTKFTLCHCPVYNTNGKLYNICIKQQKTVQHNFHINVQLHVPQNVLSPSIHTKHVLALEGPLSRSQDIHKETYAECNKIMPIQWEILWNCTCKICQNTTRNMLAMARAQIFKIHKHSCFHKQSKCYSSGTHPLKYQGSDIF